MNRLGQAGDGIAAFDLHGEFLVEGISGAHAHFDFFSGALTDEKIVGPLHVVHHGGVELVAGHADGFRKHDAVERNDGDLGGAAADVHDHIGGRFVDRETDADGGGHGLGDRDDVAGTGVEGGVLDGALFHLGDAGGNRDDDAGRSAERATRYFANEVTEHRLGDVEIGDHAVFHGADGGDIAGGAAEHLFGLIANGADLAGHGIEGDHRRLAEDDTFIFDVNERVGGAEVDADVVGEITEKVGHD